MKRFIFGTVLCFSLFGMVGNVHAKDESKFEKRIEQAAKILTRALKCGPFVPFCAQLPQLYKFDRPIEKM